MARTKGSKMSQSKSKQALKDVIKELQEKIEIIEKEKNNEVILNKKYFDKLELEMKKAKENEKSFDDYYDKYTLREKELQEKIVSLESQDNSKDYDEMKAFYETSITRYQSMIDEKCKEITRLKNKVYLGNETIETLDKKVEFLKKSRTYLLISTFSFFLCSSIIWFLK